MSDAKDSAVNLDDVPPTLPEIVSLREMVAQLEREHGDLPQLEALRSALGEEEST